LPAGVVAGLRFSLGGTIGGLLLLWLASALPAWRVRRQLVQSATPPRRTLVWYGRVRMLHLLLVLVVYLATLFVFGWGHTVRRAWGLGQAIAIDELLILLPFMLGLLIGWNNFYTVERTLHEAGRQDGRPPFWSRSAYLLFQSRTYVGLLLVPIFLFNGIHEALLWAAPKLVREEWFVLGSAGVLALLVLVFMPWMLVKLWGAQPLPAGELRDRLTAAGARLRFRCTDILLWNTRGGMANAMVTGLFRTPRYVMLTDSLVEHLTPDEVEAVFGHEVGHVRHHHMLFYLAFLLLSLTAVGAAADRFLPALQIDWYALLYFNSASMPAGAHWLSWLGAAIFLGGYLWLVFGFLSRRCERQADVHGCKAVSQGSQAASEAPPGAAVGALNEAGIRTFVSALEKVASLNGIGRDKPSWRHSSIARRVAFLEKLAANPHEEPRFQARLWWTKLALISALGVLALAVSFV
jgi:STE24 endopeptidase